MKIPLMNIQSSEGPIHEGLGGPIVLPPDEVASPTPRITRVNDITPPDLQQRLQNWDDTGKMSFFDHLNELRVRIIHSAVAIALGASLRGLVSPSLYWHLPRGP